MTAAAPLARYSAVEGALASGFAIADLHHAVGHDPPAVDSRALRMLRCWAGAVHLRTQLKERSWNSRGLSSS
ncbi:MAG: hypothetical protein E5Y86_17010 [Mesorhizobium sp.]|nr:MAG: hypothetical protein E5Y86_17010 [Mesorhizobium sp.]